MIFNLTIINKEGIIVVISERGYGIMSNIFGCNCLECYENDNLNHRCLLNEVTLDFTGTCENVNICDEYDCDSCKRYNVCLKDKKMKAGLKEDKPEEEEFINGGVITLILYCDNTDCDFNIENSCTNGEGIYLDENGKCTSAKYVESEGIIPSDEEEDYINSI